MRAHPGASLKLFANQGRIVGSLPNHYHSRIMFIPKLRSQATMALKVPVAFWLLVLQPAALALSCRPQPQAEKTVTPTPAPQPAVQIGPPGFPPTVLGKPYPGAGILKIIIVKRVITSIDPLVTQTVSLRPAQTIAS